MFEVIQVFPNSTALLQALPAEVGLVVLRGLVRISGTNRGAWNTDRPPFNPVKNLVGDIVSGIGAGPELRAAAGDAIAWLFSHDLVSELHLEGASNDGTVIPTPLGYAVAAAAASGPGAAAHAIRAIDLVPPSIRQRVVAPLVAGDYDVAIGNACKAVEVRMRERAGLPTSDFGSRLARKFFQKVKSTQLQRQDRKGDLADEEHLFEGLFGMYRDRAVHEAPHVDSMEYALEVIVTAAHMLRIVEAAELND